MKTAFAYSTKINGNVFFPSLDRKPFLRLQLVYIFFLFYMLQSKCELARNKFHLFVSSRYFCYRAIFYNELCTSILTCTSYSQQHESLHRLSRDTFIHSFFKLCSFPLFQYFRHVALVSFVLLKY